MKNPKPILTCPRFVSDFLFDSKQDRSAGLVQPYSNSCYTSFDLHGKIFKNPVSVNQPHWLHESIKKSNLGQLGAVTQNIGQTCSASVGATPESYSRFYYAAAKLNAAAKKNSLENVRIQKLLEQPLEQVICPDEFVFQNSRVACENEKKCSLPFTFSRLANKTLVELEVFKKSKRKLEELSSQCKKGELCQNDIKKLSDLINALVLKNPWFLDSDFLSGDDLSPGYRLSRYLKKRKEYLTRYQSELENASRCLHFENSENCNIRQLREILENSPDVEITGISDVEKNKVMNLFNFQSCQDQASLERDRTADMVNAPVQALIGTSTQIGVEGVLEKIALGRFKAVKSAAKILIPKMAGLFASESAMHLLTDSSTLANIKKSCFDKRIELSKNASQNPDLKNKCSDESKLFGADQFDEASCMVDIAMAAVATAPAFGADKAFMNVFKSSKSVSQSSSSMSFAANRGSSAQGSKETTSELGRTERRGSALTLSRRATDAVSDASHSTNYRNIYLSRSGVDSYMYRKLPTVAQMPRHIEIVEVTKIDGRKSLMYTTVDRLKDGTWVRSANEFQIDKITGAIDATSPAGKDLFERLAAAHAGKAHFAFFDVARLGFVNNQFKNLAKDGDAYLKGVADTVQKHGKGLVTLARTGGDEFGLIVHEADPVKAKKILEDIRNAIRDDKEGLAKQVFVTEKIDRAEEFKKAIAEFKRKNPEISDEELRQLLKFDSRTLQAAGFDDLSRPLSRIEDIARTSTPDVSVGSTGIGAQDNLSTLGPRAEDGAKEGKIETAYERGLDPSKYGDRRLVKTKPNPNYRAPIQSPTPSPSWSQSDSFDYPTTMGRLRPMNYQRGREILRVGDTTVAEYTDELGRVSYRSERYVVDFKSQQKVAVLTDIPTKGSSGLLDGTHPEADYLISNQISKSDSQVVVQPKIRSLKYLNYFGNGTQAGDEVIAVLGEIMKKNARPQDLNFKMNGADFLWGGDGLTLSAVAQRMEKINQELIDHPRIKKMISDEVASLTEQIQQLKSAGRMQEASDKAARLQQIRNFDFDLQFETLTSKELRGRTSIKDIQNAFDDKFKKRYP